MESTRFNDFECFARTGVNFIKDEEEQLSSEGAAGQIIPRGTMSEKLSYLGIPRRQDSSGAVFTRWGAAFTALIASQFVKYSTIDKCISSRAGT